MCTLLGDLAQRHAHMCNNEATVITNDLLGEDGSNESNETMKAAMKAAEKKTKAKRKTKWPPRRQTIWTARPHTQYTQRTQHKSVL